MSSSEDGDGDLMGSGVDMALSLSGVLMIVVVILAQLWLAQNSREAQRAARPATPPATPAEDDRLTRAQDEITRLQGLLQGAAKRTMTAQSQISGLQDALALATNEANARGAAADAANTDAQSLRGALDGAAQGVKAAEGRLAAAEKQRDDAKRAYEAASRQLAGEKQKQAATEGQLAGAVAERDQAKQGRDAVLKQLAEEKGKLAAAQAALTSANDRYAVLAQQVADLERRNDKPPLISISDESFRTFEEGSAVVSNRLAQYLAGKVKEQLYEDRKKYGATVIEVVGHTDEVPIRKKDVCNLDDELLEVLNGRKEAKVLAACDNVALGMARAAAVVNEFRKLGLTKDFTLLALSAGPAISMEEALSPGNRGRTADPARRRIEIRLKRRGE